MWYKWLYLVFNKYTLNTIVLRVYNITRQVIDNIIHNSYQKSDYINRCALRTILQNFIQIQFEMMRP